MFSLLGGQWRGRKLKSLERDGLRPSSSRVKSAIFSILEAIVWKRSGQPDFSDWHCADLFAGMGGLGLEILSRGAKHCVFVEKDRTNARALQENIATLGCGAQATLVVGKVEEGRWEASGPFDLILLDPPYADSNLPELLRHFVSAGLLKVGGVVLFEHDPKVKLGEVEGLSMHSTRTLGPAGISVYLREV